MTIADGITAVSAIIAAISFAVGVNAWRREFIGKRRIELAENVLALFYEAQDAFREIRNPFSLVGEGSTRKRDEYESKEETTLLNRAYVVIERYQKREKLFAELRSNRYRFMAAFGPKSGEPFDELNKIRNEILLSANILGTYYWQRQGRVEMSDDEFKKHLAEMHKYEAVFWFMGEEDDEISQRTQSAVGKIEEIVMKESLIKKSWFSRMRIKAHGSKSRT